MTIKSLKPNTPAQRGTVLIDRKDIWKGKPFKSLVKGRSSTAGRNNQGKITSRRMGSGVKRNYRIIDFKRNKFNVNGNVQRIEYDPYRSAFIALIKYEDNDYRYIIAPQKLKINDNIISSEKAEIKTGNCLPLKSIPLGTMIHNVELKPGKGAQIARSAGSSVSLLAIDGGNAIIKLNSGEIKNVNENCFATVGTVSNLDNKNIKILINIL